MTRRMLARKMLWGVGLAAILVLAMACASAPQAPQQPAQPAPAAPAPTAMPAAPAAPAPLRPQLPPAAPIAPLATAAPTAATAAARVAPSGTLLTATNDIRFPVGIPRFSQAQSYHMTADIVETPFHIARAADGNFVAEPRLALSYTLDPQLKYADVKIRRGVQFHEGWGEMTTEDIAWSFNDANAGTNPESVHDTAGDLAAMFKATEAIDADTVRFNFNVFASNWAARVLTDFWEGPSVYSKKVFDKLGVEGMREKMIGTGPVRVIEYTQAKVIHLEAFEDHWNRPSYSKTIKIFSMPEDAARRAAMETGEVYIANLPIKDWPDLLKKGFKQAPEGFYGELALSFGGNWWDDKAIVTGAPIERTLDLTKPYVSPSEEKDPARWKSARDFRLALGYAIDREALNKGILGGLGKVGAQPGWPVDAKGFKEDWKFGYDLAKAKQLLKDAGYADGATVDWWVDPTGVTPELAEAIAGIWQAELKIKTNFDKTQYNASFRPSIIKRSVNKIWFCGTDGVNVPNLWPKGFLVSTVSNGGFMCGTEQKKFGEIYLQMARETDAAKLQALAVGFHDELRRTGAQIGVVDVPTFPLYNTSKIAEWTMRPEGKGGLGGLHHLWTVKLK